MPGEPSDLTAHNCLHYSYFGYLREWPFMGAQDPVKVQTSGSYQVNNSEALLEAVLGGLGIGRFPTFVAGPHIAAGRLVRLLKSYRMPEQTLYAIFPERRHLPLKVRAFVDYLAQKFGGTRPYWDHDI